MANTDALTIPFCVRPEAKSSSGASELGRKISQIIDQKGHFRDVTENNLLSEDSGHDGSTPRYKSSPPEEEANLMPEKRTEKLWSSRELMVQQWSRGMDELLTTLDFLSLLLSKQSAAARAGMSPGIQAAKVPAGSFEPKVVKFSQPLESKTEQEAGASRGWKAQGFESASMKLSAASKRLRKEAGRESQFWLQAASLKAEEWNISRHPRDSKAIGLHFGLAESAPHFRNRSFALLKQDDDGKLYLDRAITSNRQRRLRIAIERDGQLTALAPVMDSRSGSETFNDDFAIEARDQLLEDELFHEMSREARLVSSQDVMVQAQTISLSLGQHYKIMLSYSEAYSKSLGSGQDYELAKCIQLSLRALLLAAHQSNLQRRSRPPQVLSTRPTINPELFILRPLVSNLRHWNAFQVLQERIVATIVRPLEQAGFHNVLESVPHIEATFERQIKHHSTLLSTNPIHSTLHLVLPGDIKIDVRIMNSMDEPIYGIRYEVSGVDFDFARVTGKTYTDLTSVVEAVHRETLLALAEFIRRTKSPSGEWKVTMPQKAELAYYSPSAKVAATKVRIQIQSQNLILQVIPAIKQHDMGKSFLAWSWNATETHVTGDSDDVAIARESAEELTFVEVISKLGT